MIHFAKLTGNGSLCSAQGDVRWIKASVAKEDACPSCWVIRIRLMRITRKTREGIKNARRRRAALVKMREAREEKITRQALQEQFKLKF